MMIKHVCLDPPHVHMSMKVLMLKPRTFTDLDDQGLYIFSKEDIIITIQAADRYIRCL